MARKLRIQYPGAIYHTMNRGDRREPIFLDDKDRGQFLQTLGEACQKTDWQVHVWHQPVQPPPQRIRACLFGPLTNLQRGFGRPTGGH